jgi:hypothetical protein
MYLKERNRTAEAEVYFTLARAQRYAPAAVECGHCAYARGHFQDAFARYEEASAARVPEGTY